MQKQLTDNEFIDHMITHHEVAVYMSEKHLHNTKNPIILDILRKVIAVQKYEILKWDILIASYGREWYR